MNFDVFISEYLLILTTMAVILFTANELVKLLDYIHILFVTRRVRKLARQRAHTSSSRPKAPYPTSKPEEPENEAYIAKPEWVKAPSMPSIKINGWALTAGIFLAAFLGLMYYILVIYKP